MHLQDVHSINKFCKSRPKTLRLERMFYSRTNLPAPGLGSPTFKMTKCSKVKIVRRLDFTISNCSFDQPVGWNFRERAHQGNWQPQRNRNFRELLSAWVGLMLLNGAAQIEETAESMWHNSPLFYLSPWRNTVIVWCIRRLSSNIAVVGHSRLLCWDYSANTTTFISVDW
jgi:hypothetical protein